MAVTLGVNVDHVATLRQQRRGTVPSPVEAAKEAERHGADSIVIHLREDRRHIQESDAWEMKKALKIPLALEMAATQAMSDFAVLLKPARVCLVPERREELTTEGGLDVIQNSVRVAAVIEVCRKADIAVSLFLDPDVGQIEQARRLGAQMVELHTGRYADAPTGDVQKRELQLLQAAGAKVVEQQMELHAGHGLTCDNVRAVAQIIGMKELNIGFSIISRALFVGMGAAVKQMKEAF